MKKCTLAIVCLFLIGISTPLHAALQYTNLLWYQNGLPIDELTLQINESVTLQLHDELAVVEFYDLEIGNSSSPVADIASVSQLMGDLSYAQQSDPDYWLLHYEWGPTTCSTTPASPPISGCCPTTSQTTARAKYN